MAAPVIGVRPRYAPKGGVSIDPGHPLSRKLEFCFIPALGNFELVRGILGTPTGNPAPTSTAFGPAKSSVRSPQTSWKFQIQQAGVTGSVSALFVGRVATVTSTNGCILSTTDNVRCPIDITYGSTQGFNSIRTGTTNYDQWRTPLTIPVANSDFVCTFAFGDGGVSGTAPVVYHNGSRQAMTRIATGSGPVTAATNGFTVGARPDGTSPGDPTLNIVAVWSRAITEAEAEALYADPFCFLRY